MSQKIGNVWYKQSKVVTAILINFSWKIEQSKAFIAANYVNMLDLGKVMQHYWYNITILATDI